MSGHGTLWVPPSFEIGIPNVAIPLSKPLAPGYPDGTQVMAGNSIPTIKDLTGASPPTVLETWDLYSLSIAYGILLTGATPAGTGAALLQLLINDHPAWSMVQDFSWDATDAVAGVWTADFINSLRVGARDRLGLAASFSFSQSSHANVVVMIGAQPNTTWAGAGPGTSPSLWTLAESTISYRVNDAPAVRPI